MGQFINHFSFLIFIIPALLLALVWLLRGEGARWKQITSVMLVAVVTLAFFLFNPGQNPVDASEAKETLADAGKPILLEFYSDY